MRPVLILVLLVTCIVGYGKSSLSWYQAVVVLDNNDVIVGEIVIEPSLDVVLVKAGNQRTFYPASRISYINLHDNDVKFPRKFLSLQQEEHGRLVNKLYEVVLQGEFSVIRKPRGASLPHANDVHSYDYFIKDNASIIRFSDFRSRILPVIENYYSPKPLMKFLNEEQINPSLPSDVIKLIDIYNDRLPIDKASVSARNHSR
jgi:hypothetical protein